MYEYQATMDRVVDGDTVDIVVDLGFKVYSHQRVRLAGLNSPERNTADGVSAANFVKEWFANHTALVVQSAKPGGGDKYGRYLAVIRGVNKTGLLTIDNLNDDLISNGHAVTWNGQGEKPV